MDLTFYAVRSPFGSLVFAAFTMQCAVAKAEIRYRMRWRQLRRWGYVLLRAEVVDEHLRFTEIDPAHGAHLSSRPL